MIKIITQINLNKCENIHRISFEIEITSSQFPRSSQDNKKGDELRILMANPIIIKLPDFEFYYVIKLQLECF